MATQEELLDVLRSSLSRDIAAARIDGTEDGAEFMTALAELFAAVSLRAVEQGVGDAYILTAPRGQKAASTISVQVTTASAVTLAAGSTFSASDAGDAVYSSISDVAFTAGTSTESVDVVAVWSGAGLNGDAGEIDTVDDAAFFDAAGLEFTPASVSVVGTSPAADGGRFAALDLLARGRGVIASASEDAETLRRRAWEEPIGPTPADIVRIASLVFWESGPDSAAPYDEVGIIDPQTSSATWDDAWAWDDSVDGGPLAWWTPRAPWFAIFLPDVYAQQILPDYGNELAYNDSTSAAWDETDAALAAIWSAVRSAVDAARAAGVRFDVFVGSAPTA